MNQKTRISLAVVLGIFLTMILVIAVWEKNKNNTVGTQKTEQKQVVEQNQEQKEEKNATQPTTPTLANEAEEVSFCGKAYNSDNVIINNINIAKTISRIAEKEIWICKNMEMGKFQESGIGVAQKKEESDKNSYFVDLFHKGSENEERDPFNKSPFIFKFDFQNNTIFYQNQFDGSFKYIGIIK